MTTIVGIQALKETECTIMASDLSRTQTFYDDKGDVVYREQIKSEGQKIYIDKNGSLAIAMSGIYDSSYVRFLNDVLDNKIDLKKVVEKGFFQELTNMNLQRCDHRLFNYEKINSLLLATRFDNKPKLYTCWPLGRVEERTWVSIGSGSKYAEKHISDLGLIVPPSTPPDITLEEGIDLAVSSLDKATQDIYTGGLDLVVVTPDGIRTYGAQIKNELDVAKSALIEKIKFSLKN